MKTVTHKQVNGVNVDQLYATVEAIKKDPSLAESHFRAHNKWVDGGHCRTTIQDFYTAGQEDTSRDKPFVMDADEPPVLLGQNAGANPVEFALTALSSCLTTSLIYQAAAQGIKIEELESELEGDLDLRGFLGLDEKIRNGYQNIRVKFRIKADAPEEKLRELVELAQQRSPVFDIVTNPVPVKVELAA